MNTLTKFDHEKLKVYQKALQFVSWVTELLASLEGKGAVRNQLDRAMTSIPLNIAEGNGKFSTRDRRRFLQISIGSALECAACLDVIIAKGLCEEVRIEHGKKLLGDIVRMLMALCSRLEEGLGESVRSEGGYLLRDGESEKEKEKEKE